MDGRECEIACGHQGHSPGQPPDLWQPQDNPATASSWLFLQPASCRPADGKEQYLCKNQTEIQSDNRFKPPLPGLTGLTEPGL